jgi:hypothetical protein
MKKFEKGKRKKRKKKFKDLWNKCIPLSDFSGRNFINVNYMKQRREIRYKYEVLMYKVFGYEKLKKEVKTLYKGFIGDGTINQRSLEDSDRRCKDLTFNHDSNVDESLVAAEHDDMNEVHIGRQIQDIESTDILIHGTRCEALEIVQSKKNEEFISSSNNHLMEDSNKRTQHITEFEEDAIYQRNSMKIEQKCGSNTFNHDSTVDESLVAAEHDDMNELHIGRQSQDVERNIILDHGKICLNPEIVQAAESEEYQKMCDNAVLEEPNLKNALRNDVACFSLNTKMPAECLGFPNNPNNLIHVSSTGLEAREFSFIHEDSVFYVGMKSLKKGKLNQIDFAVIELKRTLKQEFELLLNRGRLFYTKSGLFGVNISSSYQFGCEVFKLAPAAQPR